ncbi:MAG: hypothetical protein R3E21_06975 [Caenibius sp.]
MTEQSGKRANALPATQTKLVVQRATGYQPWIALMRMCGRNIATRSLVRYIVDEENSCSAGGDLIDERLNSERRMGAPVPISEDEGRLADEERRVKMR